MTAYTLSTIATIMLCVAVLFAGAKLTEFEQRIKVLELQDHSCQCVTVESYPDDSIFYEDPICK